MLQFIAIAITFNNLNFQKSKYVNSANFITGGLYAKVSSITEYVSLKSENKILAEENTRLKNLFENNKIALLKPDDTIVDIVLIDRYSFVELGPTFQPGCYNNFVVPTSVILKLFV